MSASIAPLRDFVRDITALFDRGLNPPAVQLEGVNLLRRLVSRDDWLPDAFARPDPQRYSQYLLHCDPAERFSVVSFVWGPGQSTPLHDHRIWGLIGMLRGREVETQFVRDAQGRFHEAESSELHPGEVTILEPDLNDYHRVANASADTTAISIHVYGGNIGGVLRATYDPASGARKAFISGYSNDTVPNLWDRSRQTEPA
ncbi:putative metal-dependent enzyme (double-stranded beta helix superfamily) [Endobacter medicaginis]|uniref:Cysteine dioxygenase n=1 Tax=Endobacter medicaginis TaxID=1181271 RepID=A0A839UW62_9PROT|nr:cysteine dioxygenase [Endobacter medicaginis]MBB3172905.1 putative metal-dependent enzyme (double-stranded beta helix superfamily) [Endobacter medicaginis]MCX5474830.1 cysteine dioxygenase [Endobacter medicaginis]NVN31522.1 cysteine dioxygenase [Endobacter medicaginis]